MARRGRVAGRGRSGPLRRHARTRRARVDRFRVVGDRFRGHRRALAYRSGQYQLQPADRRPVGRGIYGRGRAVSRPRRPGCAHGSRSVRQGAERRRSGRFGRGRRASGRRGIPEPLRIVAARHAARARPGGRYPAGAGPVAVCRERRRNETAPPALAGDSRRRGVREGFGCDARGQSAALALAGRGGTRQADAGQRCRHAGRHRPLLFLFRRSRSAAADETRGGRKPRTASNRSGARRDGGGFGGLHDLVGYRRGTAGLDRPGSPGRDQRLFARRPPGIRAPLGPQPGQGRLCPGRRGEPRNQFRAAHVQHLELFQEVLRFAGNELLDERCRGDLRRRHRQFPDTGGFGGLFGLLSRG
ncbi:MAG: hypothetical protein BWZ10_00353 [candidate division BRC1 bacterium ADurb.BinA364]|nr:MAG: hypothetical protein BWZ10_00353 [candidate division BRC1 bacterium ADurb.BinA364]